MNPSLFFFSFFCLCKTQLTLKKYSFLITTFSALDKQISVEQAVQRLVSSLPQVNEYSFFNLVFSYLFSNIWWTSLSVITQWE